ncbi:MAG: enoyl-CoA hydratase/isomerase family protein [Clostridia bacterium]|nr:enoyl-CoA hydratase/isomerase family protein [Clostridia bacterium]
MANSGQIKNGVVYLEAADSIGIMTIDNGSQNKIPKPDFVDLNVLKEWIHEQDLKGLIITGQGRHFSAGADVDGIRAGRDNPQHMKEALKKGKNILSYIEALPIVTVAAVSGVCFGAGLEIALSCQFRICTESAVLAFPESNLGIMPGLAGTIRLPRKTGRGRAIEIILSGRTINAEEAYNIGLVDRIVQNKTHISSSIEFIRQLTQNKSNQQIKFIIEAINNATSENYETACYCEGDFFVKLLEEEEFK